MKKIISFALLYLQMCVSCNPTAFAGSPFIWGADSRAQGLQQSGAVFSNGMPIDFNGPVNYIGNNSAVINTKGWAIYADAAGPVPVDCTGGSGSVFMSRATSAPLRGTTNFLAVKAAGNLQGQGLSYDFTIDNADVSKTLAINIATQPVGANYVSGDNGIFIYDVANGVLITPTSTAIPTGTNTFKATFTATTSTAYRLCIHTTTTNSLTYSVKYDDFYVGPNTPPAAVVPDSSVSLTVGNGHGSTNTAVKRFTNSTTVGSALTYADSATLGMSVTCNTTGIYQAYYQDIRTSNQALLIITKNSTALTSGSPPSETDTFTELYTFAAVSNASTGAAITFKCAIGDVVRAQDSGANTGTGTARFKMLLVSVL